MKTPTPKQIVSAKSILQKAIAQKAARGRASESDRALYRGLEAVK